MSFRDLESEVLQAARIELKNHKLRLKDIMEWKSAPLTPQEGEACVEAYADGMKVWVCVKKEMDKRG